MKEIQDLLERKVIFHCTPRGGSDGSKDFDVVHTTNDPLEGNAPEWTSPSLAQVYKFSNGLSLFQPSENVDDGFRLFDLDELKEELDFLKEIFDENRDRYKEESDFEDLDEWLDGLIPIAEVMASGDKFAFDTYNRNENGECPIRFLDHEAYCGGCCDPEEMEVISQDAISFLREILNNPLNYVASHWTGGDFNQQWYPDRATIA